MQSPPFELQRSIPSQALKFGACTIIVDFFQDGRGITEMKISAILTNIQLYIKVQES